VILRGLLVAFVVVLLQACGAAHVKPGTSSDSLGSFSSAYIDEIKFHSQEQNGDSLEMNKKMEQYAESELNRIIKSKSYRVIEKSSAGTEKALAFKLDVSIVYGSRAARYFVGFGAGKGSVNSQLQVVDSTSNEVVYSASAESDLSVGGFGGSMEAVIRQNIEKLLATYPRG
jgi:hypothetical protein